MLFVGAGHTCNYQDAQHGAGGEKFSGVGVRVWTCVLSVQVGLEEEAGFGECLSCLL